MKSITYRGVEYWYKIDEFKKDDSDPTRGTFKGRLYTMSERPKWKFWKWQSKKMIKTPVLLATSKSTVEFTIAFEDIDREEIVFLLMIKLHLDFKKKMAVNKNQLN